MKVSDYVINYLKDIGVEHVFVLTGGACTHLIDSFRKIDGIDYVCVQHEQAGAMMADAYSRMGGLGVVITTSGPGATNLLTGTGCSWFDSIPVLYLTGQVNTYEYKGESPVRQVGFQETDIVSIITPLSKYAKMVMDPYEMKYELQKAIHIATTGRPGPVLLDIPLDVQRADIDIDMAINFGAEGHPELDISSSITDACWKLIGESKRPLILAGGGVRNARATEELRLFAEATGIPVVSTFCGIDAFPHRHPLWAGFIGVYGHRSSNFIIANCDLLIGIGSRFDSRQTGTRPRSFAREAKKIVVDIDNNEINKRVIADIGINSDAAFFLNKMMISMDESLVNKGNYSDWYSYIRSTREKYPVFDKGYYESESLNPYVFMRSLSDLASQDQVFVLDAGANLIFGIQTISVVGGRRLFSAGGMSPMGYSFPAAIGAAVKTGRDVVCTIGDGGMQINIQELQTIRNYNIPVKIFVLNNMGYGMIKQFQDLYFDSRYEATGRGYSCPDFKRVAEAYYVPAEQVWRVDQLRETILRALTTKGPYLVEVLIDIDSRISPKLEVDHPIEDSTPYLNRDEFESNMIIAPWEEK